MNLLQTLQGLGDKNYAEFHSKLIPNIEKDKIIGVRIPVLRKFAKEFLKTDQSECFLDCLPHYYYDENMLHGLLVSEIKDYAECVCRIDDFLPFVDNWAVCDIASPKVFSKYKNLLTEKIEEWIVSKDVYTVRFGIKTLMNLYLDADFSKDYLELVSNVKTGEYYVDTAVAWFFATALAKQPEYALPYFENGKISGSVLYKAIRKSIESYRVSPQIKEYLKNIKQF